MIYTITLNPAIDREITVPELEWDSVLRATGQRVDVGGKGVNVSRAIEKLGGRSVATGFAGGETGSLLCAELQRQRITADFVQTDGETRTNVSVVAADGNRYLKVNEAGPDVSPGEQLALRNKLTESAEPGDWCVLSGSLPPGVAATYYATLIDGVRQAGADVILDTSGDALNEACASRPFLVVPNLAEATEVTCQAEPLAAARALRDRGAKNVVVTLGPDGALLVTDESTLRVAGPAIDQRNPIGAGDALVGGLVYGLSSGLDLHEALRLGVGCGTIAASLNGTDFGDRAPIEQILSQIQITQ